MAKQVWRGGALLSPTPAVLVTSGTLEKPNVLTIGWTGIINTVPPRTYVSIRPSRHSYGLIKESGEFVINLTESIFSLVPPKVINIFFELLFLF